MARASTRSVPTGLRAGLRRSWLLRRPQLCRRRHRRHHRRRPPASGRGRAGTEEVGADRAGRHPRHHRRVAVRSAPHSLLQRQEAPQGGPRRSAHAEGCGRRAAVGTHTPEAGIPASKVRGCALRGGEASMALTTGFGYAPPCYPHVLHGHRGPLPAFHPTTPTPGCRTTATGLVPQPLWLLLTAADVDPRVCGLSRLLPDIVSPVRAATPCIL